MMLSGKVSLDSIDVWHCCVDGCDWEYAPDIEASVTYVMPTSRSLEELDAAVNKVAIERAQRIESGIRQHLESHDVLDFVRTIHRLNCDLYQPHSGVRPHADRVAWSQPDANPVRDVAAFMRLAEEREANTYGLGEVRSHGESDHPPA